MLSSTSSFYETPVKFTLIVESIVEMYIVTLQLKKTAAFTFQNNSKNTKSPFPLLSDLKS